MTDRIKTRKPTIDEGWERDFANKLAQSPVDEKASILDYKNNLNKTMREKGVKSFNNLPEEVKNYEAYKNAGYKKGGKVKSASARADGCCVKGKTRA
jgi:hypothetical protein